MKPCECKFSYNDQNMIGRGQGGLRTNRLSLYSNSWDKNLDRNGDDPSTKASCSNTWMFSSFPSLKADVLTDSSMVFDTQNKFLPKTDFFGTNSQQSNELEGEKLSTIEVVFKYFCLGKFEVWKIEERLKQTEESAAMWEGSSPIVHDKMEYFPSSIYELWTNVVNGNPRKGQLTSNEFILCPQFQKSRDDNIFFLK